MTHTIDKIDFLGYNEETVIASSTSDVKKLIMVTCPEQDKITYRVQFSWSITTNDYTNLDDAIEAYNQI